MDEFGLVQSPAKYRANAGAADRAGARDGQIGV
jgi:hypothetical protein